jgi:hypothetical protein
MSGGTSANTTITTTGIKTVITTSPVTNMTTGAAPAPATSLVRIVLLIIMEQDSLICIFLQSTEKLSQSNLVSTVANWLGFWQIRIELRWC